MTFLKKLFRQSQKNTAQLAKERLQIIVSHQRGEKEITEDYLPKLQQDIISVIAKYVAIDEEHVKVELERQGDRSVLELNITLPEEATT